MKLFNMYCLPNINLLSKSDPHNEAEEMEQAAREGGLIEAKSEALGARLNVMDIVLAPQVISFNCVPAEGVLARNLPRLEKDLQLELGCQSISIYAPDPGTKYIKVEIPAVSRRLVMLRGVL